MQSNFPAFFLPESRFSADLHLRPGRFFAICLQYPAPYVEPTPLFPAGRRPFRKPFFVPVRSLLSGPGTPPGANAFLPG